MIELNINNVEELIFFNKKIQKDLPEFQNLFNQWLLAYRNKQFKFLGKRSLIEFLNNLNSEHVKIIQKHLKQSISVDKIDYKKIQSFKIEKENLQEFLDNNNINGNLITYLDDKYIYISVWR